MAAVKRDGRVVEARGCPTLSSMAKRDPRDVLGVERGASPAQIKAAWRRLARTNHPDLTGDDPAASRAATTRMAEINDAYATLTRKAPRDGVPGEAASDEATFDSGRTRRGGPPPPRPTRPVTGRVDMSHTYRARNQVLGSSGRRVTPPGQPPIRSNPVRREPPRASTPTGPLVRDRLRHFRRAPAPALNDAQATVIEFGKFHGHTLGQIAAFEPSYIDWLAGTVSHDPDLVQAARAIQADLDRRGVARRAHPSVERSGRSA
jgi:curved DNA-binding protein CbpA